MILASVRKDFTSTLRLADTVAFREIKEPKLAPFTALTDAELALRVAGRKWLVLVHGYRVEAARAVKAYWKVGEQLRAVGMLGAGGAGYDEIIGFLWPGGWAAIDFFLAVFRANRSAKRFEKFVISLLEARATVDIQTHSLGARVALEGLDDRWEKFIELGRVRGLHLTAPAVDDETIEQGDDYDEACRACGTVYVFHSKRDSVLKRAYRIGDAPEFDVALGYHGPQHPERITPNTKVIDCQDVVAEHGGYRDADGYFAYWKQELEGSASPQFVRLKRASG